MTVSEPGLIGPMTFEYRAVVRRLGPVADIHRFVISAPPPRNRTFEEWAAAYHEWCQDQGEQP